MNLVAILLIFIAVIDSNNTPNNLKDYYSSLYLFGYLHFTLIY